MENFTGKFRCESHPPHHLELILWLLRKDVVKWLHNPLRVRFVRFGLGLEKSLFESRSGLKFAI
jgi:uncharacterized protein (DUF2126 family)